MIRATVKYVGLNFMVSSPFFTCGIVTFNLKKAEKDASYFLVCYRFVKTSKETTRSVEMGRDDLVEFSPLTVAYDWAGIHPQDCYILSCYQRMSDGKVEQVSVRQFVEYTINRSNVPYPIFSGDYGKLHMKHTITSAEYALASAIGIAGLGGAALGCYGLVKGAHALHAWHKNRSAAQQEGDGEEDKPATISLVLKPLTPVPAQLPPVPEKSALKKGPKMGIESKLQLTGNESLSDLVDRIDRLSGSSPIIQKKVAYILEETSRGDAHIPGDVEFAHQRTKENLSILYNEVLKTMAHSAKAGESPLTLFRDPNPVAFKDSDTVIDMINKIQAISQGDKKTELRMLKAIEDYRALLAELNKFTDQKTLNEGEKTRFSKLKALYSDIEKETERKLHILYHGAVRIKEGKEEAPVAEQEERVPKIKFGAEVTKRKYSEKSPAIGQEVVIIPLHSSEGNLQGGAPIQGNVRKKKSVKFRYNAPDNVPRNLP